MSEELKNKSCNNCGVIFKPIDAVNFYCQTCQPCKPTSEETTVEELERKLIWLTTISGTSKGTIDHPNIDKVLRTVDKMVALKNQEQAKEIEQLKGDVKQWKSSSEEHCSSAINSEAENDQLKARVKELEEGLESSFGSKAIN